MDRRAVAWNVLLLAVASCGGRPAGGTTGAAPPPSPAVEPAATEPDPPPTAEPAAVEPPSLAAPGQASVAWNESDEVAGLGAVPADAELQEMRLRMGPLCSLHTAMQVACLAHDLDIDPDPAASPILRRRYELGLDDCLELLGSSVLWRGPLVEALYACRTQPCGSLRGCANEVFGRRRSRAARLAGGDPPDPCPGYVERVLACALDDAPEPWPTLWEISALWWEAREACATWSGEPDSGAADPGALDACGDDLPCAEWLDCAGRVLGTPPGRAEETAREP